MKINEAIQLITNAIIHNLKVEINNLFKQNRILSEEVFQLKNSNL